MNNILTTHLRPLTVKELKALNLKKSIYRIIWHEKTYKIIDLTDDLKLTRGFKFYVKKHAVKTLDKLTKLGLNNSSIQLKINI